MKSVQKAIAPVMAILSVSTLRSQSKAMFPLLLFSKRIAKANDEKLEMPSGVLTFSGQRLYRHKRLTFQIAVRTLV